MLRTFALIAALAHVPAPVLAQDRESTLADIRQELSILYVEVQRLKRELSTTGTPDVNITGTSALERIAAMESELQRLTSLSEELEFRIDRVVEDGTNRIGDLEFRLCELEADCDIGSLGDTPSLGGVEIDVPAMPAPQIDEGGAQLAVGERADFEAAKAAFDAGNFQQAADAFAAFAETYTGGPLTGAAHYWRGEALSELGRTSDAARAYLESFSGSPTGEMAPRALLNLGLKLDQLGQTADACATLGEVTGRFPESEASIEAQTARADLGCS